MEEIVNVQELSGISAATWVWFEQNILALNNLFQLLAIVALFGVAWLLSRPIKKRLSARQSAASPALAAVYGAAALVILPLLWLLLQWLALLTAEHVEWPHGLLTTTVSLIAAWVIIRAATMLVRDPFWSTLVAIFAWSVAALNITGLLGPMIELLDSAALQLGNLRISAFTVIKGLVVVALLLWFASLITRISEQRIYRAESLSPSARELFTKLIKVLAIGLAVIVGISSVGIDLTAFAVIGGAIGVGIGFGLQKIVSNLFSGFILLMDRSIKPGDVISVGETFGWVNSLSARYVSVITRDGIEHLIPNEELVINRVENWSYSHENVRLKIPVGIHYKSDVRKAIALCLEAAAETERVLDEPKSVCLLKGFGDSSVDLEIRIWINDPPQGRSNVISQVLLKVWDKFHEHGIEIPYPQRDLHLRTPPNLEALLKRSPDQPSSA